MNWFYVLNGYRAGPVPAAELLQLLLQRTIAPTTLVWREGMEDWLPYAQVAVADPTLPAAVACSQCGGAFPPDQVIALGTGVICANCKPVAFEKFREGIPIEEGVISLRRQYLGQETSLRSGGVLFLVLGAILGAMGLHWTAESWREVTKFSGLDSAEFLIGIALVVFGGFQFLTGLALRQLKPAARIPSIILAAIAMLAIPIGTLIGGYLLFLLLSKRGRFILSRDYRPIVVATPQIKYRISVITWVAIGILLLAILGAVVGTLTE